LFDERALVRLGSHPEVAVCLRCVRFLGRQARARADETRPSLAARARDVARAGRREVMRRSWHNRPLVGPALRWLGQRLP
jgi:hypothetical protein